MTTTEQRIRDALHAEAEAWPPPTADLPSTATPQPSSVRRPLLAIASGFAGVIIVVGIGSLVLTQGRSQDRDPGAGTDVSTTVVEAGTVLTHMQMAALNTKCLQDAGFDVVQEGEGIMYDYDTRSFDTTLEECVQSLRDQGYVLPSQASLVPLSALPILGLDLPDWVVVEATETDRRDANGALRTITYGLSDDGEVLARAIVWIQGVPDASVGEGGHVADYSITSTGAVSDHQVSIRGHDVQMVLDDSDYFFTWMDSPDVVVNLAVFSGSNEVSKAEALIVAGAVIDLNPDLWAEYLARDLSDVGFDSNVTTTATGG
jgi:hypothetical protein